MHLNDVGLFVSDEWQRSETMREEVILDAFVVMPTSTTGRFTKRSGVNHLHGIICLVLPEVDDVSPRGYDLTVGPNPKTAEPTTNDGGAHGDAPESVPNDDVGTTGGSSLHSREAERPKRPPSQSLSAILAGFKSAATKRINQHRGTPGAPVWKTDGDRPKIYGAEVEPRCRPLSAWRTCRRYIEHNPAQWPRDQNHSARRNG